jgi:flagella basal body P-ring formation protein FlgA
MYTQRQLRRNIQLAIILSLLALASQLLRPIRARGEELPQVLIAQLPTELGGNEKFVPGGERFYAGATLELRNEVSVIGEEVKLKSVCRWADSDKAAFDPIADLVLTRVSRSSPFRSITTKELRDTLHDAGVNLAVIRFAGATSCTVSRTDVKFDERSALDQWIATRDNAATKPALITPPATQPAKNTVPEAVLKVTEAIPPSTPTTQTIPAEKKTYRNLKDFLVADVVDRLNLAAEQLQFHFNPADDKLLALAEPHFQFAVAAPRNRNLGEITWDVTILADDAKQKTTVTATVRAWQNQLVVNKPLGYRQILREEDLIDRKTLVDRTPEDPLVTREQVVGQMAGRELKSGTVLTARLIDPTILVKTGQLVSITLTQGAIQAKSVAKAMEQGTLGQTIRVKNEITNNVFDVVVTGPQTAKLPPQGAPEKPNNVAIADRP